MGSSGWVGVQGLGRERGLLLVELLVPVERQAQVLGWVERLALVLVLVRDLVERRARVGRLALVLELGRARGWVEELVLG